MNQSIAVSHLKRELQFNLYKTCYIIRVQGKAKGKDQMPFADAVLRCLVLLFDSILYVPHAVGILSEAAIEGVQASVDALKLLYGGWCLK